MDRETREEIVKIVREELARAFRQAACQAPEQRTDVAITVEGDMDVLDEGSG